MAPRRLDTEIFSEAGTSQTYAQMKWIGAENIEQAQRREQRLKLRRLNVGANREPGLGALGSPIIEQLLLLGNDELGSNGLILRCQVRLLKLGSAAERRESLPRDDESASPSLQVHPRSLSYFARWRFRPFCPRPIFLASLERACA